MLSKKITGVLAIAEEYMKKTLSAACQNVPCSTFYYYTHAYIPDIERDAKISSVHLPVKLVDRLSLLPPSWSAERYTCAQVSLNAWQNVAVCCSWTSFSLCLNKVLQ